MKHRVAVNPIACTGHGICAEILPEMIGLDEWGYPIISDDPVPHNLAGLAKRAVRLCPTLALRLEAVSTERRVPTGGPRADAGHRGRHEAEGAGRRAGQR